MVKTVITAIILFIIFSVIVAYLALDAEGIGNQVIEFFTKFLGV